MAANYISVLSRDYNFCDLIRFAGWGQGSLTLSHGGLAMTYHTLHSITIISAMVQRLSHTIDTPTPAFAVL